MKIAYLQKNGVVAIVIGVPKERLEQEFGRKFTDEEYKQKIMKAVPADATNVHELPADWVAPDRALRAAWTTDGKTIVVDEKKAARTSP
jgi:hypothetical protein